MTTTLKVKIKRAIPPALLDRILLRFPRLYETGVVNYETNLDADRVDDLLGQLGLALHLEGDVIECGSSRGGSTALMGKYLQDHHSPKRIYACDSFEGFDRTELAKEVDAGTTSESEDSFTSTSLSYFEQKLAVLGMREMVTPVKGYFEETLPSLKGPFCFGFIDCDLHDSLVYSAETIWPRLESGGRLVFDDYGSDNFRAVVDATEKFVDQHEAEIVEHGPLRGMYYVAKA